MHILVVSISHIYRSRDVSFSFFSIPAFSQNKPLEIEIPKLLLTTKVRRVDQRYDVSRELPARVQRSENVGSVRKTASLWR